METTADKLVSRVPQSFVVVLHNEVANHFIDCLNSPTGDNFQ